MRQHGLPRPQINVIVAATRSMPISGRTADRRARRLGLPLDRVTFESDRDRDADTLAGGLATVRITWARMTADPRHEADRLHAILENEGWLARVVGAGRRLRPTPWLHGDSGRSCSSPSSSMSTRSLKKQSRPSDPQDLVEGLLVVPDQVLAAVNGDRVVAREPLYGQRVVVSWAQRGDRIVLAGMYQRVGRFDSNSAIARSLSASSSPSREIRTWRSVRSDVDPVVRVARMAEHLLVLLEPAVHAIAVERDQVLEQRWRVGDRVGVVPRAGLDHFAPTRIV